MEVDVQIKHVESGLHFGQLTDTPLIHFVPIIDITQEPILVPCSTLDITVAQFIELYLSNTNNSKSFYQKPMLVIEQGGKKQCTAEESDLVAGFNFDLRQKCFRVVDAGNVDRRQRNQELLERYQKDRFGRREDKQRNLSNAEFQVNVIVINYPQRLRLQITASTRVLDLKKKAIAQIAFLQKYTPDILNVSAKGSSLSNDNETLAKYQIAEGATLVIKVKQTSGCFSQQTPVLMANGKAVRISEVAVGDEILSYNMREKAFQSDRVTFVKSCRVQQCLHIAFEDQSYIVTTANHLFLCDDGQFRCCTTDLYHPDPSVTLKVGSALLTAEGRTKTIAEMYSRKVDFHENQFYHLSVQKNHNFVAAQLIAHNMFIKIKLAKGEEQVDVSPASCIAEIKEKLEEKYFIQMHNQTLLYNGKELQNDSTIAENNIPKEATLHLICKKTYAFNLVKEEVPVMLADGTYKRAGLLKKGDQLATFDTLHRTRAKQDDMIQFIEGVQIQEYFYVGLGEYENTIGLSADAYLELDNGEAINVRDICYERCENATLRTITGETVDVKGMAHMNEPRKKRFIKISMVSSKSIIAQNIIVHDKVVNLLLMRGEKRVKKVSFGVNAGDTVELIRGKLAKLINVAEKDIILQHNENQLSSERTIESYDIQTQHLVLAIIQATLSKLFKSSICAEAEAEVEKVEAKMITLQLSETQKETLNYYQNKDKTVEQVLKNVLPNYNSAYFFTFDNLLLFPDQKLEKLEISPNFKYAENTIVLVKNEKLSFINAMSISKEDVGNYSGIESRRGRRSSIVGSSELTSELDQFQKTKAVKQAFARIRSDSRITVSDFKEKQFFMPFLYLTSRKYSERIKKFIMHIQNYRLEYGRNDHMLALIKGIYVNMQLLPNYYRKCYLGLKNFKFSSFFKKEQTFYLHSFTLAYKKIEEVRTELKKQVGTLFHITSLNGKEITRYSMFPSEEEVLFAPFTPFLIEEIIEGELYDDVYLVQLSAPITFQKDIILWVDDEPYRNEASIKKILSKLDIQILQATSTLQAEKWIKEFGWLLNWKGLQFKIVSDMFRFEGIEREGYERYANKTAGIDLLKILYNKHGFNVKTLIYCGKEQEAIKAVKNAGLKHEKYCQVTSNQLKMLQFFNIVKK